MNARTAPLGKPGKRNKEPLPRFHSGLFEPFGSLSDKILSVIHTNERWYGDGYPTWDGAPSAAEANAKRVKAANRLEHHNYALVGGTAPLALLIDGCMPNRRCGSHACPECSRANQRWLVDAVHRRLRRSEEGFEDYSFNFVMPEGQTRLCDLGTAPFNTILGRCRQALSRCAAVDFSVIGIDVSFNDDTNKFHHGRFDHGPRKYFQVHLYGITRTNSRQAFWDSLRHIFGSADNIYRPLWISPGPFDGALKGISYICKPDAFRHIPFFDKARGEWNTPIKPPALTPKQHIYYLLAMDNLGFAERIGLVGLHPVITKRNKSGKYGVTLRRIFGGKQ